MYIWYPPKKCRYNIKISDIISIFFGKIFRNVYPHLDTFRYLAYNILHQILRFLLIENITFWQPSRDCHTAKIWQQHILRFFHFKTLKIDPIEKVRWRCRWFRRGLSRRTCANYEYTKNDASRHPYNPHQFHQTGADVSRFHRQKVTIHRNEIFRIEVLFHVFPISFYIVGMFTCYGVN